MKTAGNQCLRLSLLFGALVLFMAMSESEAFFNKNTNTKWKPETNGYHPPCRDCYPSYQMPYGREPNRPNTFFIQGYPTIYRSNRKPKNAEEVISLLQDALSKNRVSLKT